MEQIGDSGNELGRNSRKNAWGLEVLKANFGDKIWMTTFRRNSGKQRQHFRNLKKIVFAVLGLKLLTIQLR